MKKLINGLLVILLAIMIVACGNANTIPNDSNRVPVGYTSLPSWINKAPAGTDGTAGTDAEYVYFGEWPQTIKDSSVTVDREDSKTVGMFTYCKGSDGAWYCETLEHSYGDQTFVEYSNGTTVSKYSAMHYEWFKVEPIKWRVLTKNYKGKILLFAENALVGSYSNQYCYDWGKLETREIDGKTIGLNNYKYSTVRACLNGLSYVANVGFEEKETKYEYDGKGILQTAFTTEEQQLIVPMIVGNGFEKDNPIYEETEDKLFCLTKEDVMNPDYGFAADADGIDIYSGVHPQLCETRLRKPCDFVLASGPYADYNGSASRTRASYYYLRSSEDIVSTNGTDVYPYVYNVTSNADISSILANNGAGTIVPALCIEGE